MSRALPGFSTGSPADYRTSVLFRMRRRLAELDEEVERLQRENKLLNEQLLQPMVPPEDLDEPKPKPETPSLRATEDFESRLRALVAEWNRVSNLDDQDASGLPTANDNYMVKTAPTDDVLIQGGQPSQVVGSFSEFLRGLNEGA